MSTVALVLVLASALMHAAWNSLLKRRSDGAAGAVLLGAGAAAVSGAAAVILERPSFTPLGAMWTVASSLVEAIYFVTLTRALARLPLGTAYGLSRGGGQLVTWPVSLGALGEDASPTALSGAAILTAGLFAKVHRPHDRAGVLWALLCAASIGLYPLTYKAALAEGVPPFTLFTLSIVGALPVQMALLGGGWRARLAASWREERGRLAVSAVLCAASFLSFLFALELGGAGRMTSLRNTSIAFAAFFGWRAGDVLDRRDLLGLAAIVAGAVLLAW